MLRKRGKIGIFQVSLGICIWLLSIYPVSNLLIRKLESDFSPSSVPRGDVIILLGGGIREEAPDLTGRGFPGEDMLGRIVTAVRLQKRLSLPIIVSAGAVFKGGGGAPIVKRILIDLGVDENQIILEDKSRDTYENAKYCKDLCLQKGFGQPILVTSGYHLQRAHLMFAQFGLQTFPYPAYLKTWENQEYQWYHYLPDSRSLANISAALHEYLGICFYQILDLAGSD
ncbi:MAG: YdcF family protein [Desulfobacterales bacterium]|nr:MAG: YdcF family protein [Desulfobacterales bacterium]